MIGATTTLSPVLWDWVVSWLEDRCHMDWENTLEITTESIETDKFWGAHCMKANTLQP